MTKPNPFKYFKTSPEIIRLAVMMYVRSRPQHMQPRRRLHAKCWPTAAHERPLARQRGAPPGWRLRSVLAETQTAILPLVPYLDTLRWVFIAVALGGIAVTICARLDDWRRGRR